MARRILKVLGWILLAVLLVFAVQTWRYWDTIQRVFLGGKHDHETVPPTLPASLKRPAFLVFSKTNAFRHEEAIPAANAMFDALARENGWTVFKTENGAAFSPEILARFDAVVFSNASGDLFTPAQQLALKTYLQNGGGYVGIHAAGDNSHVDWKWYMTDLLGTTFIGHPLNPQFQRATVRIEDRTHPATRHLGPTWSRTDEWYSFDRSPRGAPGIRVLASLDEGTYSPKGPFGQDIRMGKDHPIVWWRCIGKGRMLYSALGHTAQSFSEPEYRTLLSGALNWAMRREGDACGSGPASPPVATGARATAGTQ